MSQALLSRVYRKGVGWQVTYAGHPLYLFDRQAGAVTGEGWFEPGLPPWHGVWWLLSPYGQPVPWAGTLTTTKVGGKTVLAETYQTGIGFINFPVYTFSADQPYFLVVVLGQFRLPARLALGAHQRLARLYGGVRLRYRGDRHSGQSQPGHLVRPSALPVQPGEARPGVERRRLAAGNGNGIKAFGGTFSLVVNP